MHMNKVTGLLVLLCCELCLSIQVPLLWNESVNSAVKNEPNDQVEFIKPQNVQTLHQSLPIPIDYFQYTAKKPQFAAEIAAFHGVRNPQQYYKAYPIKPYTGNSKPSLGIHHMLNEDKTIFQPYQKYVQKSEEKKNLLSSSNGHEVFQPYKLEEPALQEIYKDPILKKIRNDLQDSKLRLQTYEEDASKTNITDDEYLEGQHKTDLKLFPQNNNPARYEIHRPERRPVYYRVPPRDSYRDQVLNQRFKHPWNQHNIKIRPVHYKPLRNHIHDLRQHHAIKYDDERNEYPQVLHSENIGEPQDGYDIYEKGKHKYTQLRNNVDESINKAVQQNKPVIYQKLELQKNEAKPLDEDDEFIPIKNYAQVRKTETFKHVPKKSAFDDAETYEEILNAPRLREAVKSTKAQTVYSEEGYEDSAYDHAGEQKHASDHEGHGGFLKEKEKSGGLYRIPTVLGSYKDGKGSEYRDNVEHGKKWTDKNKEDEEETNSEDYSEDDHEKDVETDIYNKIGPAVGNRNKREREPDLNKTDSNDENRYVFSNDERAQDRIDNDSYNDSKSSIHNITSDIHSQHEMDKRETNFKVPEINLNSTYLTEGEILEIAKHKLIAKKDNIKDKYPYYFKNLKAINRNSPLRYAENLKLIPKKSIGGTEFYDSRSILECPEVDDEVDPLPEKLKKGKDPTKEDDEVEDDGENNAKQRKDFDVIKQPRLRGLGDKIDCFKAKYFGENPLDSPFFKERLILSPEPIIAPSLPIYKHLKNGTKENLQESKINSFIDFSKKLDEPGNAKIFELLDKLRTESSLQNSSKGIRQDIKFVPYTPQLGNLTTNTTQHSNVYTDIITNINNNLNQRIFKAKIPKSLSDSQKDAAKKNYDFFQNKEEVTQLPPKLRKRRAAPFIYEPYKIIRDSQVLDSKKTTTTSNISPLIRQLQSSRVVDRVSRSNRDDKKVRSNSNSRLYVDIGRKDRKKINTSPVITDVSIDHRRGEPRYEIKPRNHKSEYTPVDNKRAMSVEDFKTLALPEKSKEDTEKYTEETSRMETRGRLHVRQTTTERPFYDVSQIFPKADYQNVAASTSVRKMITTTTPATVLKNVEQIKQKFDDKSDESVEEYDDEDEEEEEENNAKNVNITITTTTTPKPIFRRRIRVTTSTDIPQHRSDEPEKLKLITRFHNYSPSDKFDEVKEVTEATLSKQLSEEEETPKYREKKKKSSKSTLVTDTQKYGDDDDEGKDDLRRKEVDALMGIKQDMDDYMPSYEREEENKNYSRDDDEESNEEEDSDENDDEDDDDEDDDDFDFDRDDDDYEEDSNKKLNEEGEQNKSKDNEKPVAIDITTPEPTKRTLTRTTDAPPPTVASHILVTSAPLPSRSRKPLNKPIITRKKIEIHKELPVNNSLPHLMQFKQDISEVEVIKEIPTTRKRKPQRKIEALQLYKDDNLAKDINKLDDVEIFKEAMDLDKGPKHGGNYKQATKEDLKLFKPNESNTKTSKDIQTSQSQFKKLVEVSENNSQRTLRGNLATRTRNAEKGNKLETPRILRDGKTYFENKRRGERKSEKIIELDDDREDSSQEDDYKSSSVNTRSDRLHGGNYRSAKLVVDREKESDDIRIKIPAKETTRNAAAVLNSFVQAVPVLTTTPGYIVDPSKRMYYYVDT